MGDRKNPQLDGGDWLNNWWQLTIKCLAWSTGLQPWCMRNVPNPTDAGALCSMIAMKMIMPKPFVSPNESTKKKQRWWGFKLSKLMSAITHRNQKFFNLDEHQKEACCLLEEVSLRLQWHTSDQVIFFPQKRPKTNNLLCYLRYSEAPRAAPSAREWIARPIVVMSTFFY